MNFIQFTRKENEVDRAKNPVLRGSVQLAGELSEITLENNNENRTKYKLATVKYVNGSGEIKTCSAKIYETSYMKEPALEVGGFYSAKATRVVGDDGKATIYMQMFNAVPNAGFADDDDFDFEGVSEGVESSVASVSAINS